MDIIFKCTACEQELAVDAAGAGTEIECPSCGEVLVVPEPKVEGFKAINPMATSAAAKVEHHFAVPQHDTAAEALIEKPLRPLDVAAKEGDRKLRIRTFRRSDCVEVGKDHFDEVVSRFLEKVGETNVVNIAPVNYTHQDLASHQWITDFGVMIVYKG